MGRVFVAILLSFAFAVQPLLASEARAECPCCERSGAMNDDPRPASTSARSCCTTRSTAISSSSERTAPANAPANHDHKTRCPMACCAALAAVGLYAGNEPLLLPMVLTVLGLESLGSPPAPVRSTLKRPPRAITPA